MWARSCRKVLVNVCVSVCVRRITMCSKTVFRKQLPRKLGGVAGALQDGAGEENGRSYQNPCCPWAGGHRVPSQQVLWALAIVPGGALWLGPQKPRLFPLFTDCSRVFQHPSPLTLLPTLQSTFPQCSTPWWMGMCYSAPYGDCQSHKPPHLNKSLVPWLRTFKEMGVLTSYFAQNFHRIWIKMEYDKKYLYIKDSLNALSPINMQSKHKHVQYV